MSLKSLTSARADIPPNDDFASAIDLGDTNPAQGTGSSVDATQVSGESAGPTVWWSWTAPSSGTASVDTSGSTFQTLVRIFTGNFLTSAQLIPSVSSYEAQEKVEWQATAGVTYRIGVGGYNNSTGGIRLVTAVVPRPVNDRPEAAIVLPGTGSVHTQGSSVGAFDGSNESESPSMAVWWSWTASASGVVEVDVSHSSFPAYAGVYLASPPGGPPVESAKLKAGQIGRPGPVFRFSAEAGATYAIAAGRGSSSLNERGMIDLRLTQPWAGTPPANDNLAQAAEITTLGQVYSGDNTAASAEFLSFPNLPNYSGRQNFSLWYRWIAPAAGSYGVMFRKPLFHPYCTLNLYQGSNPAQLQALAMYIGMSSRMGSAAFQVAAAGDVFYFEVGAATAEDAGAFSLQIQRSPVNDAFAQAIDLGSLTNLKVEGSNIGSTQENSEGYLFSRMASVWYQWRAPVSGTVTLAASSRELDRTNPPYAAVFTGNTLNSLARLLGSPASPQPAFSFEAVAGKTYKIAVLTGDGFIKHARMGDGEFTLHLTMGNFGPPYQVWLLSWPELKGDTAVRSADPDGDGWNNLQELAFEGNPLIPDDIGANFARNFESDPPGIRLYWMNFVFLKGSGYGPAIVISPEVSNDGVHWGEPLPGEYTNGTTGSLRLPFSRASRSLARLRVTEP